MSDETWTGVHYGWYGQMHDAIADVDTFDVLTVTQKQVLASACADRAREIVGRHCDSILRKPDGPDLYCSLHLGHVGPHTSATAVRLVRRGEQQ